MAKDRLSGLDASFLHLERGPAHMHVASTAVFDGPAPDYEEFRAHIASRLHLVPRFRQKLRFVPFSQGRPRWVDDPCFHLEYHLRHTALPAPGSDEQLRNLAARIFSQRLDRSKPLWELWLVDGLEGGRFAIIGKSHHCLVDGVSGVDITTVLYDAAPDAEPLPEPPAWTPAPEPSDAELLAEALVERATTPAEVTRGLRAVFRTPRQAARAAVDALEAAGTFARTGVGAPPSPFNVDIGPYRRFATVQADLGEFKRVKNSAGGTVNDVILAVVAGALGRYLRSRGHSTHDLELRAMVPISVRGELEQGALGNRVSSFMAPLPVWCEDPLERLARVREVMGDLKESKQAVGATLMTELADFAPPTIAGQAARLQARQRFFNLVVTNVPGPQFPLYLLGRELQCVFPMVPLAKRQALCFAIMSYNGQVNFGLTGDYDAMADLDLLGQDVRSAIDETVSAVASAKPGARERRPHDAAPVPRRPVAEKQ
ncbi:MAG TPA: wax ester/triacylglycerol synthase family O-acyltransferase [Solirubrobacterales bacterium]|nr:wax ester/triacylglycerol synthase family O-acyltransferase [Solirubrobacterales bacterium]